MYGWEVVFLMQLGFPVMKFLQDGLEEPNAIQRRICKLIEVQQTREMILEKSQIYKVKVKATFEKNTKENDFKINDLVLRWDVRREEKGKHGKFDNLWFGPFMITKVLDKNTFILKKLDGDELSGGLVNGYFL